MNWFNGTYTWLREKLEAEFPVQITADLRVSEDGKKMAVINHFAGEDPLGVLVDPKAEEDDELPGTTVFYHTFTGNDAAAARECLHAFLESGNHKEERSIVLLRQDPERLFQYAYGHVCSGLISEQALLQDLLPEDIVWQNDVFVLPLKRHMFRCPVCGRRTLLYRGDYIICTECGWEDDGTDDEDRITGPNGDYTIRLYRKKYQHLKRAGIRYDETLHRPELQAQLIWVLSEMSETAATDAPGGVSRHFDCSAFLKFEDAREALHKRLQELGPGYRTGENYCEVLQKVIGMEEIDNDGHYQNCSFCIDDVSADGSGSFSKIFFHLEYTIAV